MLVDVCALQRAGMASLYQGQHLSFEVVHDERIGDRQENLGTSGLQARARIDVALPLILASIHCQSEYRQARAGGWRAWLLCPSSSAWRGRGRAFLWSLARQVGKLRASVALKRRCGLWAIGGAVILGERRNRVAPAMAGRGGFGGSSVSERVRLIA